MRFSLTLFLFAFLFITHEASAQVSSKEQVAFYNNVYSVDEDLDRKLNYFSEKYPGFQEALLFKEGDDQYTLQITVIREGKRYIEDYTLNNDQYQKLIKKLASITEQQNLVLGVDRSGRYLKIQSISLQSALGGSFISSLAARSGNGTLGSAAFPLVLGGGIVGSILATRNQDVPLASSLAYASGAFTGGLKGLSLGLGLDFESGVVPTGTALAFSIGESSLLRYLAAKNNWSAERASAIRVGNLAGFSSGVGLSLAVLGENFDENPFLVVSALGIAGSVGGMLLFDRYFKDKMIPAGNMQAIRIMNPIFTIGSSIAFVDILGAEFSNVGVGSIISLTSIGGVFLGELLFKKGYVSYTESLYYGLGAYGGGLIGTGISTLLTGGDGISPAFAAGIFTVFSIGSMYLVHRLIATETNNNRIGFLEKNGIQFSVNPLAPALNKRIAQRGLNMQQSAFSFQMRF